MARTIFLSTEARKFGGKNFYWHGHTRGKRAANKIAKEAREAGYNARMTRQKTKYGLVYNIWARKKGR